MARLSSVLLVDDDSTDNFLNQMLLGSMQVADHVLVAESGPEALQTLADQCPEPRAPACPMLVLLDVNMPGMNGIEFLEAYRHTPQSQHPPVIIMLATSMRARDLDRLEELSIAGLVQKPLTREKVETILQLHF